MKAELFSFSELPPASQRQLAQWVALESKNQAALDRLVVPVDPDDVIKRRVGVAAVSRTWDRTFVGYVGARTPVTHENGKEFTQVSTLLVAERYRGFGIAHWLVNRVTRQANEEKLVPFAFCDPRSLAAFAASGYAPADPADLPEGISSPYGNQPMIYADIKSAAA